MKIEIEIPDWCDDGRCSLFIMKGIELVAYKHANQEWKIKTGRCNMCGKCCPWNQEKPRCEHLNQIGSEWWCRLGSERPWSCSLSLPQGTIEGCTEIFE